MLAKDASTYMDTRDEAQCIIVSNRGPIEYYKTPEGEYKTRHGSGWLITVLLSSIQRRRMVWIALAMTNADRLGMQGDQTLPPPLSDVALRLLDIPEEIYKRYYYNISNHLLWFAQHALLDPAVNTTFTQQTREDWEKGYCAVNDTIADATIRELDSRGTKTPVIFQDYQLYLAPGKVRLKHPDALLGHVIYIPWPDARYLAMLPDYIIQSIYRSMAMNDFIGFQTLHDAQNFLVGATYFLEGADVQWDNTSSTRPGMLFWHGRRVQICLYPATLSPEYLHPAIDPKDAEAAMKDLYAKNAIINDRKLILRVDRVEPTKNIIRGFEAYEQLLKTHPEMHRHVTFVALLIPSREGIPEYYSYEQGVRSIIERINALYGQEDWQPIIVFFGNDRSRALASFQHYDVLLVNPIVDGMNLVVKEGAMLNKRSGAIILSRTAGAHDTLGEHVLSLAPLDLEATTSALYRALTMSQEEREYRAGKIHEILTQENANSVFDAQIEYLRQIDHENISVRL